MITVDITTKNTVFNPLSAQGSWIQHRFGKRNYPDADLPTDIVSKIIQQHNLVFLRCVYGDPLCHPSIDQIIDIASQSNTSLIIFSYLNIDNSELIEKISKLNNITVYVPSDGIESYGTTILNSSKQQVFNNLKILRNRATLEYYLYSYNIHELEAARNFCNEHNCMLKTQPGKNFGLPFTSIIDSSGAWLYDVKSLQDENTIYDSRHQEQTVEGYRSLLYYTNIIDGASILDKPVITKMYKTTESFPADMPAVSVTGHVFNSTEEMFIFSNALCADWAINVNTLHMSAGVENNVDKLTSFVVDQYAVLIAKTLNQLIDNGFTRFSDSDI